MEDITHANYAHAKRVCKDLEIKILEEYHDLYDQSDTLLLADLFENFRNICLKIYKLDPGKFLPASGLAWEAAFKKTKVKFDLLTDIQGRIQELNRPLQDIAQNFDVIIMTLTSLS